MIGLIRQEGAEISAGRGGGRRGPLGAGPQALFLWITYVLRMSVVYGSLAVVPIFLIWLYVAGRWYAGLESPTFTSIGVSPGWAAIRSRPGDQVHSDWRSSWAWQEVPSGG
jgi:hypothetical protein